MELLKKIEWDNLQHEYGLDGQRFLPWNGVTFPFGGAYCVVAKATASSDHINEPADEGELFIGISGMATVRVGPASYTVEKGFCLYIPPGLSHSVENPSDEDFHFCTIWWNSRTVKDFLKNTQDHE